MHVMSVRGAATINTGKVLIAPEKPDMRNARLIARFNFCEQWYLKCLEIHSSSHLDSLVHASVGGLKKGTRIEEHVAYVNTAIQRSYSWCLPLLTAKIDIARMFTSTRYTAL